MKNPNVRTRSSFPWPWVALALLLVGARAAAPMVLKHQINRTLGSLEDYQGRVKDVDFTLWRGAFQLQEVVIKHRHQDMSLTIGEIDFRIRWLSLFHKHLIARIEIQSPRMRMLVDSPLKAAPEAKTKAQDAGQEIQKKTGKSLPDLLISLIPFRIEEFVVKDGTYRLREKGTSLDAQARKDEKADDFSPQEKEAESPNDVRITDLNIRVTNLTNSRQLSGSLIANGRVTAKVMGKTDFWADLKLDPLTKTPTFDLDMELKNLELTELNPFFRWQWNVDAERGTFAMFAEAAAADGRFKGYVKPFIHDVKMVNFEKDKKHPIKLMKEAVVGAVASIFQNKDENAASRIPFQGKFENPSIGVWEAVVTVFRNAFIEALRPGLDRSVSLKDVK